MKQKSLLLVHALVLLLALAGLVAAQADQKADAVFKKAVAFVGGDAFLKVRTQVGRGSYSIVVDGMNTSYQTFVDVIVLPDKERTEFKEYGRKTVQTNVGDGGWFYNEKLSQFLDQSPKQVDDFKRSLASGLDGFLRGSWKGKGKLTYAGRREASLGKRNDVLRLTYDDGFVIEFEFDDTGQPMKSVFTRTNPDGVEQKEEDRFAQFIDIQGVKFPMIVDHFSGGKQSSRINYESVEFNKQIPDSVFAKPSDVKAFKKDLKF